MTRHELAMSGMSVYEIDAFQEKFREVKRRLWPIRKSLRAILKQLDQNSKAYDKIKLTFRAFL